MNELGLTINLAALAENYRRVQKLSGVAEAACVVKANAYGLGVERIAPALVKAGANTFFVATLDEAIKLRALLSAQTIYVFNGLAEPLSAFSEYNLRPCLSSPEEMMRWRKTFPQGKAAVHIDTGIHRLGISVRDFTACDLGFTPALLMTHLSSADRPRNPSNQEQLNLFIKAVEKYDVPKSVSNSAGLFLGDAFQFQMTRAGVALYGGNPLEDKEEKFLPVVSLAAPIGQIKELAVGARVGYGGDWQAQRPSTIAVIALGYADGYPRNVKNATAFIEGKPYPLVGRVSMDMLAVDITDSPQPLAVGTMAEFLGENITINALARRAGTIPHNILTELDSGRRNPRHYKE